MQIFPAAYSKRVFTIPKANRIHIRSLPEKKNNREDSPASRDKFPNAAKKIPPERHTEAAKTQPAKLFPDNGNQKEAASQIVIPRVSAFFLTNAPMKRKNTR